MAINHILDRQTGRIIETLDSKAGEWLAATVTRSINNKSMLDFTALRNPLRPNKLTALGQRNRLIIESREGGFEEYIIRTTDTDGKETLVQSDGSFVDDLTKAPPLQPQTLPGATPETAVRHALASTGWEPGEIDWIDNVRTLKIEEYISPYDFLGQIASEFGMELRFRVEVKGSRVVGRYVDLVEYLEGFNGHEIVKNKDLKSVRRFEDSENLVTALIVIGPEPEEGQERLVVRVEDADALERWGLRDSELGATNHLWGIYTPETEVENVTESYLRSLGEQELKRRIETSVRYEADAYAHPDLRLGSTVRIKDEEFEPPLYLEARIEETEEDPIQQKLLTLMIGRFVEYTREDLEAQIAAIRSALNSKVTDAQIKADLERIEGDLEIRLGEKEPRIPVQPYPPELPKEGDKYINDSTLPAIMYTYRSGKWEKNAPTEAAEIGAETPQGAAEKAQAAEKAAVDTAAKDATAKAQKAETAAKAYTDDQLSEYVPLADYAVEIGQLQDQIDGNVATWFEHGEPTTSGYPANGWTTPEQRDAHLGDIYYNRDNGHAYRWMVEGGVYKWERLADTDITKALNMAAEAQETADGKMRVFIRQPLPPYDVGDLWAQGETGDLLRATVARPAGAAYVAADWEKAVKYTDDTRAVEAEQNAIQEAERLSGEALASAQSYAQTKAGEAQIEAIRQAAADAKAKADAALSAAKTDATDKASAAQAAAIKDAADKLAAARLELDAAIEQAEADAISVASNEAAQKANAARDAAIADAESKLAAAQAELDASIASKADKATTYTKTDVDNALNAKVSTTTYTADRTGIISRLDSAETSITQNADAIKSKASQTSVDSVAGRISKAETTLTQHATAISSKAEQTIVNTLTGRVDTAESTLTQHAEAISSRVTKTELTGELAKKEGAIVKAATAPTAKVTGDLWLDTSKTPNVLNRWSGTAWIKVTPTTAAEVGAYSTSQGTALAGRVSSAETTLTQTAESLKSKAEQSALDTVSGVANSAKTTAEQTAQALTSKAEQTTVNTLTGRVDKAETTITQHATAISSKAEQSSVNALTGRVDSAESSISQNAAAITQRVTKTELTGELAKKEGAITKANTAPTTKATGDLWLDTSKTPNVLNRWSGTAWVKVTPTTAAEVGAYSTSQGSALAGRISSAETTITQHATAITSKAEQTIVDALAGRVSTAESTISQQADQIKSKVDATFVDKAVKIDSADSGISKTFRNVLNWQKSASTLTGMLVIRTPINGRHMTNLNISGYNYRSQQSDIDLTVSFYNYTTSLANSSYSSKGTYPIERVRVARYNGEAVALIIGETDTVWSYPAINIDQALISLSSAPDSYAEGWSAEITNTMPEDFTLITNVPGRDFKNTLETHSTEIQQNTADIKLKADKTETDGLTKRMSSAEQTISAHDASIKSKAEQTTVNGLTTRISTAEQTISAHDSAIKNKAEVSVTNGLDTRISTAEQTISAHTTSISQRVTTTTFNALESRVKSAETSITQNADNIELKVSKSVYDAFVENQENLIRNPAKLTTRSGWSTGTIETVDFFGEQINALAVTSSGSTQVYGDYFDVDPSKAYEVTLWLKSETPAPTASNAYFGLSANTAVEPIYSPTGAKEADSTNFYFWYAGGANNLAEWTKYTGYILPVGFDPSDAKGLGNVTRNARMKPKTNSVRVRWLNWSNTTARKMWMTNAYVREVPPAMLAANVRKDNVVQTINASTERLLIDFNKVDITGKLTAGDIKSLNGLNVGNGQFVVDNVGNVKFGGSLQGASGTFGKVTAGDGEFTLQDKQTGLEYYATNKRNLLEDHSFELLPQDANSVNADSIAYNWIDVRKDFKSQYYSPSSWQPVGSPKIGIQFAPDNINAIAMLGKQSAVVKSANYYRQYVSEGIAAGVTLTVSAYFRRQWNLPPGSPRLEIWHTYADGTRIKKLTNAVFSPPPMDYTIIRHGETFVVPSTFKEGDALEVIVSTGDTNWIQCDGVQMIRDSKPSLYSPEDSVWKVLSGRYRIQAWQDVIWTGSLYPLNGQNVIPDVPLFDCNIGWLLEWSEYIFGTGPAERRFYYDLVPVSAMDNMQKSMTFYIPFGEGSGSWKYLYLQDGGRYMSGSSFNNETYARNAVLRRVFRL